MKYNQKDNLNETTIFKFYTRLTRKLSKHAFSKREKATSLNWHCFWIGKKRTESQITAASRITLISGKTKLKPHV